MLSRRALLIFLPAATLAGSYALDAFAADKTITIGINLPLTGADAHDAELIKDGALLALDEANAKGGVAGYKIETVVLDSGTATAGQYDPAQAARSIAPPMPPPFCPAIFQLAKSPFSATS